MGFSLKDYMENKQSGNVQAPVIKQTGKGFSLKDYISGTSAPNTPQATIQSAPAYKSIVPAPVPTAYMPSDDDLMAQLNVQAYQQQQAEEYKKNNTVTRTREDLTAERAQLESKMRNSSDYGTGAPLSDDEIMATNNRLQTLYNTDMSKVPSRTQQQIQVIGDYKSKDYGDTVKKKLDAINQEISWRQNPSYGMRLDLADPTLKTSGKSNKERLAELNQQKKAVESLYYQWQKDFKVSDLEQQAIKQKGYTKYVKEGLSKNNKVENAFRDYSVDEKGAVVLSSEAAMKPENQNVVEASSETKQILFMNEQERQTYSYYLAKEGEKKAHEYLRSLSQTLNARMTGDITKRQAAYAEQHPGWGVTANVASSFAAPLAILPVAGQAASNFFTNENKPVDTNSTWFGNVNAENATSQGVQQAAYNAAGGGVNGRMAADAAGLGMSILQNVVRLPLGKTGALVTMAAGAAGQQATDVLNRGGSAEQALIEGTLAGAIEYITEKVPMDMLFDLGRYGATGAKDFLIKVLFTQGLTEGGEEIVSSLTNTLVDIAVMGDKSNLQQTINGYTEQGYTMKEAQTKALTERFIGDAAKSGLGGYISGVAMGAGFGAVGTALNNSQNKEVGSVISGISDNGESVRALINEGLQSGNSETISENYNLAHELNEKLNRFGKHQQGQAITNTELGKLQALNAATIQAEEEAATQKQTQPTTQNATPIATAQMAQEAQVVQAPTPQQATPEITQNTVSQVSPVVEQKGGVAVAERVKAPTLREIVDTKVNEQGLEPIAPLKTQHEGDSKSKFAESIQSSDILDEQFKKVALDNQNIQSYDRISNKETMSEANNQINEGGQKYVDRWKEKWKDAKPQKVTSTDIAVGIILMHRYQTVGDYEGMIGVAERLRKMGTKAGQAVQAFSILGRMTPEGMTKYAASELAQARESLVGQRTEKWIDDLERKNKNVFTLTPEDAQFITEHAQKAAELPDGRDKDILLAQVSARIQNKIPPSLATSLKAFARDSMLLNPRTNVRNILGNGTITPMHMIADTVSSVVDRIISNKTGVRTTGTFKLESVKGIGKGLYESYDDFRKKISTREMRGDRFEIGDGLSYNPYSKMGQALNALDRFNSFLLDAGDRPFYEMWFMNSLNNQVKLNHVEAATPEMIEIATQEALERTWQDNNKITQAAKGIQKALNLQKEFGLGTIVMPFIKTPANLARATVQFSPLGFLKLLGSESRAFTYAVKKGTATPEMQRAYVQTIGKAVAGTMLTVVGGVLAATGKIRGGNDEDKDVSAFEQNILGKKPYSVQTISGSFTYDWMQPAASNLAVMADMMPKLLSGKKLTWDDLGPAAKGVLNNLTEAIEMGGNTLYNQTLFKGIGEIFRSDSVMQGLISASLSLPSQFTPTLFGQIARIADDTDRSSFENGDILASTFNEVKSKIPGARNTLAPRVDVLGREIKSNNSPVNVFLNPAISGTSNPSEAGAEAYRVYQATGDKGVIPRQVAYSYVSDGESIKLSSKERAELQKIMGQTSEQAIYDLLAANAYKTMLDKDKADLLVDIYTYAEAKAKNELGIEYSSQTSKAAMADEKGISPAAYYLMNTLSDGDGNNSVTQDETTAYLKKQKDLTTEQKAYLWALENKSWTSSSNPFKRGYKIPGYTKK